MYDYGIRTFCDRKDVSINDAVAKYLQYRNVTDFKPKQHEKVNNYINNNWNNFANFIDKSLKSGTIKGKPCKLNTYFGERREYNIKVSDEFAKEKITDLENKILGRIKKEYGAGFLQSFLMKKDIQPLSKDRSYFSKTLQWLPLVRQSIENGFED